MLRPDCKSSTASCTASTPLHGAKQSLGLRSNASAGLLLQAFPLGSQVRHQVLSCKAVQPVSNVLVVPT